MESRFEIERDFGAVRRHGSLIEVSGRLCVNFAHWDSLGLNQDRSLRYQVHQAIEMYGIGSCASRPVGGTCAVHTECERRLSSFLLQEGSLLFSSKNQAVLSLLGGVFSSPGRLYLESGQGGGVADAALLLGAEVKPFQFENLNIFKDELAVTKSLKIPAVVFIESLSQQRSSLPPIALIREICSGNGALLVVDESSTLGTVGLRGAGALDLFFSPQSSAIVVASLARGFGGYGAVVAGKSELIETVARKSPTFREEVSLPPALAAWALAAVDKIETMLHEREVLIKRTGNVMAVLSSLGGEVLADGNSPIVDVVFRDEVTSKEAQTFLLSRGFFVLQWTKRIRLIVSWFHSEEEISRLGNVCCDFARTLER